MRTNAGVHLVPSLGGGELGNATALGRLTHWFSVEEYGLLSDAGILHEDDRLELIEGRIIDMAPIGSAHAGSVNRLLGIFVNLFQDRAIVSVQNPVQLDAYSEPQPDLMLLRPRDDFYAERHPEPEDVLLLLEVADTSLDYDRNVKIPLYAGHAIQEVWLLNLRDQTIEVYRAPSSAGYENILTLRGQQHVNPQTFPEVMLHVAQILGTEP
ncbi:MAG: Uma2 family endonuclease [bacterium]|nr:Uma2 family endonuclease [bacterium]